MGRVWKLIEDHLDAQEYRPKDSVLARRLGVSQSIFDVWKSPKALPKRTTIENIANMCGVSYTTVLNAFLDDTRYRIPPSQDTGEGDGDERTAAPITPIRPNSGNDPGTTVTEPSEDSSNLHGDKQRVAKKQPQRRRRPDSDGR